MGTTIKDYVCKQQPDNNYTFLDKEFSIRFTLDFLGNVNIEITNQLRYFLEKNRCFIFSFNISDNLLQTRCVKKTRSQTLLIERINYVEFLNLLCLYNIPTPEIELTDKGYVLKNNAITIRFSLIKGNNYWEKEFKLITPIYKNQNIRLDTSISSLGYIDKFNDYKNKYLVQTLIKSTKNTEFIKLTENILTNLNINCIDYIKNINFNSDNIYDSDIDYTTSKIKYNTLQNKIKCKLNNDTIFNKTEISVYKYFYDYFKNTIKKNPEAENIIKKAIDYEIGLRNNDLLVEIVSGYELQKYYGDRFLENKGELGNSCMNYDKTNSNYNRIQFYAENQNVVKLAIIKGSSGKIVCRALLWKTSCGKTIMDRIYFTDSILCSSMFKFCKTNDIIFIYNERYTTSRELIIYPTGFANCSYKKKYLNKYTIELDFLYETDKIFIKDLQNDRLLIHGSNYPRIGFIPYLDNFNCFDVDNMTISNLLLYENVNDNISSILTCHYTQMTSSYDNDFVTTYEGLLCHIDVSMELTGNTFAYENDHNVIYSDYHGYYDLSDNMCYSRFMDDWLNSDATYNREFDDYYFKDNESEFLKFYGVDKKRELTISSSLEEGEFDDVELPF